MRRGQHPPWYVSDDNDGNDDGGDHEDDGDHDDDGDDDELSRGTYYRQVTLRICTTASYPIRAGSQGSPAMGTEVTNIG